MAAFFFWLCCVLTPMHRLSLIVGSGSYSLLRYEDLLGWWLLLFRTMDSTEHGLQ